MIINAQEPITNPALGGTLQGLSGSEFFADLLPRLVGLFFVVGVIFAFIILILGAIQYMTSGGDKAAIEQARGRIFSALTGIVILLSVFALLKVVGDFFGVNILEIDIGPLKVGTGGGGQQGDFNAPTNPVI